MATLCTLLRLQIQMQGLNLMTFITEYLLVLSMNLPNSLEDAVKLLFDGQNCNWKFLVESWLGAGFIVSFLDPFASYSYVQHEYDMYVKMTLNPASKEVIWPIELELECGYMPLELEPT